MTTPNSLITLHKGHRPLLLSMPHAGTFIPPELRTHYQPRALLVEDTDWHMAQLYGFARDLGASILTPTHSRYVIDLNRPPDNTPMYPGASNTELCPSRFFTGDPLYLDGNAPSDDEIVRRRQLYWKPHHEALENELQAMKSQFGYALAWDCHSIRSEIPWLFEGKLPDLNLGTANASSCAPSLREALATVLRSQKEFTYAVDGRFKGGYITRHYGRPEENIHAVQLEMCQSTYMQEQLPFSYLPETAQQVQPILKSLLETMLAFKP